MPPSSRTLAELAASHFARARRAVADGKSTEAVVWSSWALEVAISAAALDHGLDARHSHLYRASLARRLFEAGVLPEDVGSLLIRLHTERKRAVYDGDRPNLRGRSWTQVLDLLERTLAALPGP